MSKIYVIDTNIIMTDPNIINKLDGDIVISTTVLQELDKHKNDDGENGKNVREFARKLDEDNEILFHISDNYKGTNDDKIIETAVNLKTDNNRVFLLTNDIYMRHLAKAKCVETKKHDNVQIDTDYLYTGTLKWKDSIDIKEENVFDRDPKYPNKYIIAKNGIFKWKFGGGIDRLGKDRKIWGIIHKNAEQKCAIDALLDDNVKLVTISGRAGTGKTLLAIAAGLEKTITENKYKKLLVSRPVIPMGKDIGFLPGSMEEKLGPWMQPIFDNIDFLFNNKGTDTSDNWEELEKSGLLRLEALTYIRGRSIPNQYIIIDEAQNLTKHEVKTIISRAGDGTKIILTGDPDQIDNPKLDSVNNGLTYSIEKFKNQQIAAHITLTKCERSELAKIAAEIM